VEAAHTTPAILQWSSYMHSFCLEETMLEELNMEQCLSQINVCVCTYK
jgi:hypothetical protein